MCAHCIHFNVKHIIEYESGIKHCNHSHLFCLYFNELSEYIINIQTMNHAYLSSITYCFWQHPLLFGFHLSKLCMQCSHPCLLAPTMQNPRYTNIISCFIATLSELVLISIQVEQVKFWYLNMQSKELNKSLTALPISVYMLDKH